MAEQSSLRSLWRMPELKLRMHAGNKHASWPTLDNAVEETTIHEQLFALMDAKVRTERGRRGGWGARITKF